MYDLPQSWVVGGFRLLVFVVFMLMFSPGYLSSDDRGEAASLHSVSAEAHPLRIEYEAGRGIPRIFLTTNDSPLWSREAQDTSALLIRVDNRVSRLSDERPVSISEADDALETTWRSGRIVVTLRTEVFDAENGVSTGRLRLSLENEGRNSRSVGVRYLLDTWLGEASEAHFRVRTDADSDFDRVEAERELPQSGSILESAGDEGTLRLLLDQGTVPEHVAVANRSRLSDAAWSYNPSRRRGFDLLPYSDNDSAVHVTFSRQVIEPGERRVVDMYFSAMGPDPQTPAVADRMDERDEPSEMPDVSRIDVPPLPHAEPPAPSERSRPAPPPSAPEAIEEAGDEPDAPATREEATTELRRELQRLREISDGDRRAEEGELEEIRATIERLRRLRDRL